MTNLSSSNPTKNSIDSALNGDILLSFDADINSTTADNSTIVLNTNQTVPSNDTAVSTAGDTVTLNPNEDFKPGEKIEVTVTSGVENTSGDAATPEVIQFRTQVTAGFANFVTTSNALGIDSSFGVSLGDLDGDGDLDAVFANK